MKSFAALTLAAAVTAATLSVPTAANACGMSVSLSEPARKQEVKPNPLLEVAAAERALEQNQPTVAARKILVAFPGVRAEEAGRDPIRTRALRVFALAAVRADGNLALGGEQTWTRGANLEWALQALREIDQKRPNDPSLQADLGEAMSHLPRTKAEAFKVLDGLAQKDLMGSPQAYAALSRLRAERGDASGAALAMRRCEGMTAVPALCVTAPKVAAAPTPAVKAPSGMLAARD